MASSNVNILGRIEIAQEIKKVGVNDLLSGLFLLNVQRSIDVGRAVHVDVVGREGLDNRGKLIFRLFHIFPQKKFTYNSLQKKFEHKVGENIYLSCIF